MTNDAPHDDAQGPDEQHRVPEGVSDATVEALGSNPDAVTVILRDVERHDWAKAGTPLSES